MCIPKWAKLVWDKWRLLWVWGEGDAEEGKKTWVHHLYLAIESPINMPLHLGLCCFILILKWMLNSLVIKGYLRWKDGMGNKVAGVCGDKVYGEKKGQSPELLLFC